MTVMIQRGTGKEQVARELHLKSDRSTGPFIRVNCASLPDTLVESELFGREKGAFTGAEFRKGRFEQAHRNAASRRGRKSWTESDLKSNRSLSAYRFIF